MSKSAQPTRSANPTAHDVAREAGVSQMTVSRVLRGDASVASKTRERVEVAAAALGYIPNRLASIQRGGDSPMVGVVLPTLSNTVFTEVLSGINAGLAAVDLRPVFGVSEYDPEEEERIVRDMLSWQPRGIILTGLEHTDALRAMLKNAPVKVVEIMDTDGAAINHAIGTSHVLAGHQMAVHLLQRGFRRAGYMAAHGGTDVRARKRYEGFAKTFAEGGGQIVQEVISPAASSMELGRALTNGVIDDPQRPDVIYYSNDDLAAGGVMACLADKIEVPRQIALAGYNGLPFLGALPLRLTTTFTPRFDIGQEAGAQMAASRGTDPTVFEPELRIGDTT